MNFKEAYLKDGENAISPITIASSIYTKEGNPYTEHTHDDRYYTESEMDTKLKEKSNEGHKHDDRYYTESEINTALSGKVGFTPSREGTNISLDRPIGDFFLARWHAADDYNNYITTSNVYVYLVSGVNDSRMKNVEVYDTVQTESSTKQKLVGTWVVKGFIGVNSSNEYVLIQRIS